MRTKTSVYKQCAAAIDRIVQDPSDEGVFTEIDIITEAAKKSWTPTEFSKSLHDANEIAGQRYRNRKLCRYGPVTIGKGKNKVQDYARIAGKIVYADAVKGPKIWKTPNGNFKKMMIEDDQLSRQGRKPAANRNDSEPWSEQALPVKTVKTHKPPVRQRKRTLKEITQPDLERMVIGLGRRVESLEEEREQREKLIAEQAKQLQATAAA